MGQTPMPRHSLGLMVAVASAWASSARAQAVYPSPQGVPLTAESLVRMCPEQLDYLYGTAAVPAMPCGRVNGRAVVWPGSHLAGSASKAAHVVWQGKVFHPCDS